MPIKARLLGLSLLIPLAIGCTPEAEPEVDTPSLGTLGTRYLDYLTVFDDVNRFYCGCGVDAGDFDSVEECVAYIGGPPVPPLLAECYAQTLDGLEEARDHVECQADGLETLHDCVTAAGCGVAPTECEQQANLAACPARSYAIEAALAENCLGYSLPPPYRCGDGTEILPWLECNLAQDCPDGSDEYAECPNLHACQDGTLIAKDWLCDGYQDCPGNDDELNCE